MKKDLCLSVSAFLLFACSQPALAADQTSPGQKPSGAPQMLCDPSTDKTCKLTTPSLPPEGSDPFRGLKWGLGVAVSSSLGGVGSVAIDPNTKVVHVTKLNSSAARGAFELHYFFKFCNENHLPGGSFFTLTSQWNNNTQTYECRPGAIQFGMGPFVSLNTSPFDTSGNFSVKLFDSVGAGWMIGFNAYDNPNPSASPALVHTLNFGVGAILDTSVNQLAVGVQDGQITSVPAANQNSLIVQTTKIGWMAIVSYRLFEVNLK
jgi:hypothetical protein